SGKTAELYTESDLIIRTIRDIFSTDIKRIIVNDRTAAQRARDFLAIASPRAGSKVYFYDEPVPLFHRYGIEEQIEIINARTVILPSGGSIVIDQTEALVAIDVNSGKMRKHGDAETTAYKTNLEATDEICRQLRLRDLGGVVVCDMIDMRSGKHRKSIEQKFKDLLKKDRARSKTAPISPFGVLEMTRQRMRPSLKSSMYNVCRKCEGDGKIKSPESVLLQVMRRLALVLHHKKVAHVNLTVGPDVAFRLLNHKRGHLAALERETEKHVTVRVKDGGRSDWMEIEAMDHRGGTVDAESLGKLDKPDLEQVKPSEDARERGRQRAQPDEDKQESSDKSDDQSDDSDDNNQDGGGKKKGRRRRRRRRRSGRNKSSDNPSNDKSDNKSDDSPDNKKKDSNGGNNGKGRNDKDHKSKQSSDAKNDDDDSNDKSDDDNQDKDGKGRKKKGRRRRRRRRGSASDKKQDQKATSGSKGDD
ncbi:MAG: ribonuclease E/G, partial [Phycisphaeraceae bacterium]|nr:ribonuclease E/G [Phycisphaeraceae bacterium]